jgi:hypothetical protein
MRNVLAPLATVIVLGLTVWALMTVFKTTKVATPSDSMTSIVTAVDANHRFRQPVQSAAEAVLLTCLSDVPADVVREIGPAATGPDHFQVTVQPALDDDEAAKIRGCVHGYLVPHVRAEVVAMKHTRASVTP